MGTYRFHRSYASKKLKINVGPINVVPLIEKIQPPETVKHRIL